MTIRKGQSWGELRVPLPDMVVVHSDAALRELVESGNVGHPIGLSGGDMMRTLGGTGDRSRFESGDPIPHVPIDIVRVLIDERDERVFVAHLIARLSWWRGPITAVMNAQFLGDWDVAPRSHPNDGKVDVVRVSSTMGVRQRWMARSRVRLGTHVPHPMIAIAPRSTTTIELDERTPIALDGVRHGTARLLDIRVVPDALTVCV